MWSDDIRRGAKERARAQGRTDPSVRDLFDAAIDASEGDGQLPMVRTTFLRHFTPTEEPAPEPAPEHVLDDIFRRASALALALDQDPAAEHVVVVASLHPDAGDPAVRGFIRQIALTAVGSYDEDRSALFDRLSQADDEQRVVRQVLTPARPFTGGGAADPACVRCGHPLGDNSRLVGLTVEDQVAAS